MNMLRLTRPTLPSRHLARQLIRILLLLGIVLTLMALPETAALAQGLEVKSLGLSRAGDRTVLTILLSRAANPQISPFTGPGRAHLVLAFPQARAAKLPQRLAGDDVLVKHVRTEASRSEVKIILEMFSERPYIYNREIRPWRGGMAIFRLTLWADPDAGSKGEASAPGAPEPRTPAAPPAPESQEPLRERAEELSPREPAAPPAATVAPTGTFEELYQLMPRAKALLDYLRGEGWTVAEAQSYDRPGKRFSRGFTLTNRVVPEMVVRIAHLPPNAPGAPYITIVDLSMENLRGEAPEKYRELRQWNFAKIRGKYEDIGDFFDDALKPLRVEIRKQCQDLAVRYSHTITNFLQRAVPGNPEVANQAITNIRHKVSPRFEGVQYTLAENPLVILNLVDFLYLRIYYVGN